MVRIRWQRTWDSRSGGNLRLRWSVTSRHIWNKVCFVLLLEGASTVINTELTLFHIVLPPRNLREIAELQNKD